MTFLRKKAERDSAHAEEESAIRTLEQTNEASCESEIDDSPDEIDAESLDTIMREYDRESNTRIWTGVPKIVITAFMAVFSLYCMYMTLFSTAMPEQRLTLFLGFIIVIGYLIYPARKNQVKPNHIPWYDIVIMAAGAFSFFYFAANADAIIALATRIEPIHVVLGIVGILTLIELCRRCVGIPIIVVVACLIIYAFADRLMGGTELLVAVRKIIYTLFYTTSGVIGTPVSVCYTYIVVFVIFGAFLERTGIAQFFIAFANRIAGWSSGGAAKVAVVSSALCGMVSGSSVGNTVTTGSVTIPMMKKTGYRPEFAAAVEAASSTGGQIMPPIMGAAAFLMAEYVGVPYIDIAAKAIVPALLYFAGIFIAVHLEAKKLGLKGMSRDELPKWGYLGKNCYLIIPLVLLVVLVATGARTMAWSATISIIAAFFIGLIHIFFEEWEAAEEKKFGPVFLSALKNAAGKAVEALVTGARNAVTVAVACSMAGMIAGCITTTGLASVLINGIASVAGDLVIIGLVLAMLCCIVLGMGVPTTANYCIMASTCAPILIQLGIPVLPAHFFVFYFGIVADITPPVALAAYAGSAIAKSKPMLTAVNATKIAIAAFLVPYIFAFNPILLMEGDFAVLEFVVAVVTALVGLFGIAAALNGNLFKRIPVLLRVVVAVGGLCMMIPDTPTDIAGIVVIALVVAVQYMGARKARLSLPEEAGE